MTEVLEPDLVRSLAKTIVQEISPEETVIFPAIADAYLRNPQWALSGKGRGDEPLAFDIDSVVVLVTPVAMLVSAEVVRQLVDQLVPPVVANGKRAVGGWINRLLRRRTPVKSGLDRNLAHLTDKQLAEIRRLAVAKARQAGISQAKALLIADALVGSLVPVDDRRGT